MTHFWDERYNTSQYVYGKEPNVFFSAELNKLKPGRILLPGEGEGRNAAYAALAGWEVFAFDQSRRGQAKALSLASEAEVNISYKVSALEEFTFLPDHYDAVALIYFHAVPAWREYLHLKVQESLRPGGRIILEGFHKEQLGRNSGGPGSPDMLFDEAMLLSDFSDMKVQLLEKKLQTLNEGSFHQGEASIIRLTGIKPK